MDKTAYIFSAGDYNGQPNINEGDLIIAADAGILHLQRLGISPHISLGDFDSSPIIPSNCEVLRYKPEKDYTDTHLACFEALKRGYDRIFVCGALGGERFDHSLANIQTAHNISLKGAKICLTDGKAFIHVITDTALEFDGTQNGYISIFSLSQKACGVSLCGLKYQISDAVLESSMPLGVSNEFIQGTKAKIIVNNGTIAIVTKA